MNKLHVFPIMPRNEGKIQRLKWGEVSRDGWVRLGVGVGLVVARPWTKSLLASTLSLEQMPDAMVIFKRKKSRSLVDRKMTPVQMAQTKIKRKHF